MFMGGEEREQEEHIWKKKYASFARFVCVVDCRNVSDK